MGVPPQGGRGPGCFPLDPGVVVVSCSCGPQPPSRRKLSTMVDKMVSNRADHFDHYAASGKHR